MTWEETGDPEYPYSAKVNQDSYLIRVNDFPDESLYTLIVNNEEIEDLEDWPDRWIILSNVEDQGVKQRVSRVVRPAHAQIREGSVDADPTETDQPPERHFDVFISYNSEDREEVREIVNQLRESAIVPWFDVDELRPGARWRPVLEKLIEHTNSAAVFLGKSGVGPWQEEEMDAVLREFLKLDRQVIPVVLPTGRPDSSATLFLGNRTWVDFRSPSPSPLKQLIHGITGRNLAALKSWERARKRRR